MAARLKGVANGWAWLALPVVLFLTFFFLVPLYEIVKRSITDPALGFGNYASFFGSETFLRVLWNTVKMSATVTVVCLLMAYPYAYVMNRLGGRAATLMMLAVLVPFWSSVLARTYAWTVLLQDSGIINSALLSLGVIDEPLTLMRNLFGMVVGMSHVLLPFMVLPMYAVMRRIDGDCVRAANNLGASPLQAFWRVFLPLSLPGVYAGSLLVFVVALGFYITPALLGSPDQVVLSEVIAQQVQLLLNWGMGSAMAMILLVLTLAVLALASRVVSVGDAFVGDNER